MLRNDVALIENDDRTDRDLAFTYDIKDHTWDRRKRSRLLDCEHGKTIVQTWAPGGLKTSESAK